jgi:6-phosphogluconolactonase
MVKIFADLNDLSHFFAEGLIEKMNSKPKGSFFSISLSGGSTPKYVFEFLSKNYKNKIDWRRVIVFWGDERCVPPDNQDSNYRMACESLLNKVDIPEKNIFRIKGESVPMNEAKRYSRLVKKQLGDPRTIPGFDLIMLGMGDDGHTASIFPGNASILSSKKLFEVAENPYTKQLRISATLKLINESSAIAFIVTGKSKAEIVDRIINKKEGWEKLPASMVNSVKGETLWLLDKEAASLLQISK